MCLRERVRGCVFERERGEDEIVKEREKKRNEEGGNGYTSCNVLYF